MKCTNNSRRSRSRRTTKNVRFRRKRRRQTRLVPILLVIVVVACLGVYLKMNYASVAAYESVYNAHVYKDELVTANLCVTTEDVSYSDFQTAEEFHAAALLQLNESNVLYAKDIHEQIYPASTTKILTAYVALKYGTLTDIVTVSENATNVPSDSSKAGLRAGDQLTLKDLLYSLMLPSGNDSAVAVAEHISGSVDEFMVLMNREARALGATNTNFVTPHGYQDENHYTTAYDLYLIFNECIQNPTFVEIVSTAEYETIIEQADGMKRKMVWNQSNQFVNGLKPVPADLVVLGGKTGTTDEAGACLILYFTDTDSHPYISIIMGADSRPVLYENMSNLIETVSVN